MDKQHLNFKVFLTEDVLTYINMPIYFLNMAHDLQEHENIITAMFHPGPKLGNPDKWVLYLFFSKKDFIKYD